MTENKKQLKEKLIGGYSVCFNEWALDNRIKNELPLLMIISSLSAECGVCFASNSYLAKLFNCTEISISQKINKLKKFGYIGIDYEKRGCEITKRFIRLKKFLTDDYKKFKSSIKKDFKDNNTSNNNTRDNNNPLYPPKGELESFVSLLKYFNQVDVGVDIYSDAVIKQWRKFDRWKKKNDLSVGEVIRMMNKYIEYRDEDFAPIVDSLGEMMMKWNRIVRFCENW